MPQSQSWELSKLQDYLLYDEWEKHSGFRVLSGFDYPPQSIYQGDDYKAYIYGVPLDPSLKERSSNDYAILVNHMNAQVKRLQDLWETGKTRDSTKQTPSYFIAWALSKRFTPPWLDWAIERNLYVPKQEVVQEKIETANVDMVYSTKWLEIQQAAIEEFFSPRHEVDAKKEEVIQWIEMKAKELKIRDPNRIATSIFTIIKPEDHSPRKRRVAPQ